MARTLLPFVGEIAWCDEEIARWHVPTWPETSHRRVRGGLREAEALALQQGGRSGLRARIRPE
ncbi:MAG: hypothetical protein OHK0015_06850 [Chloroflexi bacterium OHK40]